MSNAFRIFLTVLCTTLVVFLDCLLSGEIHKQFESCHYPSVTGRITDSEVRTSHSSRHGTSYHAYISYTYQAGRQIFFGSRLRYTTFVSSGYDLAHRLVNTYPTGSTQTIFYNPADPKDSLLCAGITGQDFLGLLFLTPFNMAMLGFWVWLGGWLRERWFKPLAGGVKIIAEPSVTRVRLPPAMNLWWALGTTGGLGLASIIVFALGKRPDLPVAYVFLAIGITYLAGAAVYGFFRFREESGRYDLIIDELGRKLSLPPLFGRDVRMVLDISDVKQIRVKKVEHRGKKGNVWYTYAPTLLRSTAGADDETLADWSDRLKANDFTKWLAEKMNVPVELSLAY